MQKRILSLICTLALFLGVFLVMGSVAYADEATDTTQESTEAVTTEVCPMCEATITGWETLTADTTLEAGGHYRLEGKVTKRISFSVGGTLCLDLAGNTLTSNGRTLMLGTSGGVVSIMNIMDSSNGQGVVEAAGGSAYSGGLGYLYKGSILNIYGGSFKPVSDTNVMGYSGGIFNVYGTLNFYDGTIYGGLLGGTSTADHVGATIYVQSNGVLNASGGEIKMGTAEADDLGHCVYIKSGGKATLSGDAVVAELAMAEMNATAVKISGTYTGIVALRSNSLEDGNTVAGLINSADISGATITVAKEGYLAAQFDTSLVAGIGRWCEACEKNVVWKDQSTILSATETGHFRLTKNVSGAQVSLKQNGKVCLDLAGYTYTGSTRAFLAGNSAGDYTVELNIMDSSENKTGVVQANGSGTGGVFYLYKNTSLNLYSGTLRTVEGTDSDNGGVIGTNGTAVVNVYGGTVQGGKVTEHGGAIYLRSGCTLNLAGGNIISGDSDANTHCIYVVDGGNVKLSGDAIAEQIYFSGSSAAKLTVNGNFTGNVELRFRNEPDAADIGNVSNATIGKECISIYGTRSFAAASGSELVIVDLQGAVLTDNADNATYYDTLEAALAAWNENAKSIRLLADNGETVNISDGVVLDLAGWDVTGAVTAAGTVYCYDSCTDDGTINDLEGYGLITGTVTGKIKAAKDYMKLTSGGYSFHKYTLKLTNVNLRPGNVGIYYTSDIIVDEAALEQIDRFGIAVSALRTAPTAEELDEASLYTSYPASYYGTEEATSVLIQNIMTGQDETEKVQANATTNIYGRPYILLKDGSYIYGATGYCNLQQLTQIVDQKYFTKMSLPQHRAYTAMYDAFKDAMSAWDVPNTKAGKANGQAAAEDGVLKVLMVGNSHGLDSTNLLYEVFMAEGLPEGCNDLVLGAMYTGGCSVATHVSKAQNTIPYDYYTKNDGKAENRTWTKYYDEQATLLYALQDENWDIVLLQEMNTSSAKASTFQNNNNIEKLFTFVANNLGYEPEFMWNMIWANPEIPESYVAYLGLDGTNGDDEIGSGAEGDDNEVSDALTEARKRAWIFQTQNPSSYAGAWPSNYVNLWQNNRQVMYNNIVANVFDYVIAETVLDIGENDVMTNATAIQYAIEWMGMEEQDMYRDYTHVSDLGRLTVAYLWYAKLTGKTAIEAPKYTLVSQYVENTKQPLGYAKDYSKYSDVITKSVNFALADPYGVIQNLTYAEYLALSAEEQAAYQASFETFSVSSGWTYEAWLAQAVAGVTYTDYARMTEEQKTAYAALQTEFATWYSGVTENLTYAEYFVLTEAEKTAYAALRGEAFDAWLAEARAAFTYAEYVMMTYEQQLAYQATFAEGEFDTHYAAWLANMTYEEFEGLTMHQKVRYKKTYSSTDAFLTWYEAAKAAYEAAQA